MNLNVSIPFSPEQNLGQAYNEVLERLTPDGWACLLDHDAMFTTSRWHSQMLSAIKREPEGTFTARTNRCGPRGERVGWQRVPTISPHEHDLRVHRKLGAHLATDDSLRDVTGEMKFLTGVLLLISRRTWQFMGGFRDGLRGVDYAAHIAIKNAGRRIFCIQGLYVYHWKRGDGQPFPKGTPICNWRGMLPASDPDHRPL